MSKKEKAPEKTPGKKWNLLVWNERWQWYTSENQPTPQQKKAWRDRKRQAQKMMDMIKQMWDMKLSQVKKRLEKKDSLTMLEVLMLKYIELGMKDSKMLIDFMNRHVPYAPTKTEVTGEDWGAIQIKKIWENKKD